MKKDVIKKILLCCLFGVFAQVFSGCALRFILEAIPGSAAQYSSDMATLFEDNIWLIIRIAVIQPVIEELFFRFLIFRALKKHLPVLAANLIQAVLFGLYHMKLVQGIYAFLIGLLLGVLFYETQTILATVGFHCIFNITGLLLDDIVPADIPVTVRGGLLFTSLVICIYLCFRIMPDRFKRQAS